MTIGELATRVPLSLMAPYPREAPKPPHQLGGFIRAGIRLLIGHARALALPNRRVLSDGGWGEILTWVHADLKDGTPADELDLLAITVQPAHAAPACPPRS
ncbi:hypothetical protein [Nonomuraea rubra]|uniref:hypothetical protein n=1 Tax=Nonomuraea rubra TaxID=46180 RepID=UPI0031EC7C73